MNSKSEFLPKVIEFLVFDVKCNDFDFQVIFEVILLK